MAKTICDVRCEVMAPLRSVRLRSLAATAEARAALAESQCRGYEPSEFVELWSGAAPTNVLRSYYADDVTDARNDLSER